MKGFFTGFLGAVLWGLTLGWAFNKGEESAKKKDSSTDDKKKSKK